MRHTQRGLFHGRGKRNFNGWLPGMDTKIKDGGRFGEGLIQHLLGGRQSESASSGEADIWREDLDLGIEVKTHSNTDPLRIPESQLDSHLDICQCGFPYSYCWYAIVKYRNIRRGDGYLFQASSGSQEKTELFLKENTTAVYVLDISVVDAIRKFRGNCIRMWRSHEHQAAVRIRWSYLREFEVSPKEALALLNLDPRNYRAEARSVQVSLGGTFMQFPFVLCVHRKSLGRAHRKKQLNLFPIEEKS